MRDSRLVYNDLRSMCCIGRVLAVDMVIVLLGILVLVDSGVIDQVCRWCKTSGSEEQ
jgi:hypothetical protein